MSISIVRGPSGTVRTLPSFCSMAKTVSKRSSTDSSPEDLLLTVLAIEQKLGRVRTVPDGPRTIDIDILLYDDLKIKTPQLTIPHPRMWQRDFVIKPLSEIEP